MLSLGRNDILLRGGGGCKLGAQQGFIELMKVVAMVDR